MLDYTYQSAILLKKGGKIMRRIKEDSINPSEVVMSATEEDMIKQEVFDIYIDSEFSYDAVCNSECLPRVDDLMRLMMDIRINNQSFNDRKDQLIMALNRCYDAWEEYITDSQLYDDKFNEVMNAHLDGEYND